MFVANNKYEILTPDGWRDFRGVTITKNKQTSTIVLENSATVSATESHSFFSNEQNVKMANLSIGDLIDTVDGAKQIVSKISNVAEDVFDIIEVDNIEHKFIVNDTVITKNCDEMAFVRNTIAKEFWTSISPTLSTGGKAIITSTPNSDEDQFWQIWTESNKCIDEFGNTTNIGINGFRSYQVTWEQHPDRDVKWAEEEEGRIGPERFSREHLCRPIIFEETLINPVRLSEMASIEPIEKQGQVRWYKKPIKGKTYVVALDPSLGTGGDNAAIQIFQLPEMMQVGEWVNNKTPIEKQVYILKEIVNYISTTIDTMYNTYYSVENNSLGEAALLAINTIGEENINGVFLSEPKRAGQMRSFRKGFNTTNRTKLAACAKLKSLIESKRMTVVSKGLISELKCFIAYGAGFAAKPGQTDDLVMATILIVRMTQCIQNFDADIDSAIKDSSDDWIEPLPFILISS